jgi:hypothetical protein
MPGEAVFPRKLTLPVRCVKRALLKIQCTGFGTMRPPRSPGSMSRLCLTALPSPLGCWKLAYMAADLARSGPAWCWTLMM